MDIVPKVSELSFENDTIRNTVPALSRYIGNENNKTMTKRQNDKKMVHACQGTRRYQVQHRHHVVHQVPRVYGGYRVVRVYGEHVHHVSVEFTDWCGYMVST